jgi:multidrug efflux pump subunit AcrB
LRRASALVRERFERTYMMVDVYDTESVDVPRFDIRVDQEKAVLSGVTTSAIEHTLQSLMDGRVVSQAHIPGEKTPVPILIKVPRPLAIDPSLLDRIHVDNIRGERVPLSELTRVERTTHDRPILRKDNERVTYVGGELTRSAPVYAIFTMDPELDGLDLGDGHVLRTDNLTLRPVLPSALDGYKLLWDGELRLTLDAWGEMAVVLGAAVVFIFLLLVGTYQSFVIPLVAMTSIPLGLAGIMPGHWLLGIPFSMASAIGTVALAGVVIRNALLIIDFIRDYQRQGKSLEEAVRLAGAVRFRPILLTAVTVVLGTLIMYTDPLFAGLATSLIFGTTASTVLTLLILPALYYQLAINHPHWFEVKDSK